MLDGYISLARTQQALGYVTDAADTLQRAKQLAEKHDMDVGVNRIKAWQARLCVAQDERRAATRWLEECGLSIEDELGYPREFEHITLAQVLITQDKYDEALRLLERLLAAAEAGGRGGHAVKIQTLQALALQAKGDTPEALAALRQALALAEPEGYVRIFADEGEPMATLLMEILKTQKTLPPGAKHGISAEYIGKLLTALGHDVMPSSKVSAHGTVGLLAQSLSERELEVLRLLASGISNREIAAQLFISLDTTKSHLKHIYGKLGVRSRTQAVVRGRELDLI